MNIKDLEIAKDLSHEERAVRGGGSNSNIATVGAPVQLQSGGGILSTNTAAQVFTPTQELVNVAPVTVTKEDSKTANVLASMGTLIGQF